MSCGGLYGPQQSELTALGPFTGLILPLPLEAVTARLEKKINTCKMYTLYLFSNAVNIKSMLHHYLILYIAHGYFIKCTGRSKQQFPPSRGR